MRGGLLFLAGAATGFALASVLFLRSPDRGLEGASPAGVLPPAAVEGPGLPPPAPAPERLEEPRVASTDRHPHRSPAGAIEGGLAERPPAPPSPGTESGVRGIVRDERWRGIAGAEVTLRVGEALDDPSGRRRMVFPAPDAGKTITGSNGGYAIEFGGSGLVRVTATAAGFEPAEGQGRFSSGRGQRLDLQLRWSRAAFLQGRLLDLAGRPLWPADVSFLFPEVSDRSSPAACAPDSDVSILTVGAATGSDPRTFPAGVSSEDATFHARLDPGWSGLIRLVVRGRALDEASWKEGDPPVDLQVDVPSLRAGVGAIDLSVLDAPGGGFVAGARLRLTREDPVGDDWGECELPGARAPGPLRLADLPPGRYGLRIAAPGYAEVAREARVEAGSTTPVEVALPRPAVVRVRLVETDGVRTGGLGVHVLDAEGREMSCELESSEDMNSITVSGVPPGKGWMIVNTNVLPLSVAEGSGPEIVFPIRRPRTLAIRWRSPGLALPDGSWRWATPRLLTRERIPIPWGGSVHPAEREGEWSQCLTRAVPGTYLLELRLQGHDPFRREIVVGEGESTEVLIE